MDEKERAVLEAVARFEPITVQELGCVVPLQNSTVVQHTIESLKQRGFVTMKDSSQREFSRVQDEDVIIVNTDPFQSSSEQVSLDGSVANQSIPQGIPVSSSIELILTPEQSKRFEEMRTDVSRTCGEVDRNEFMDWVLDMASRFTQV